MCGNSIVAPADGGRHSPAATSSGPTWAANGRGSRAAAGSGAASSAAASSTTHEREPPPAPIDGLNSNEGVRRAEPAVGPEVSSGIPDATFP